MEALLDAMDAGPGAPKWWLNLKTGDVDLDQDHDETQAPKAEQREDALAVPRQDLRWRLEEMESFVADLEPDVRQIVQPTLVGKGAIPKFERTVRRWPELAAAWEVRKQELLLAQALRWLKAEGIEPQYALRPLPVPAAVAAAGAPDNAHVALIDLLLLGKGEQQPEDGRIRRAFKTASPEQGKKLFERLARELAQHHAVPWRASLLQERLLRFGRCILTLANDTDIELVIEIPSATEAAFTRARSRANG
jgi:hypothetical protein